MKKLVLGMMLLAGMAAYGNSNEVTGDKATGTINLTANATGALNMELSSYNLDFGNLRTYTGTTYNVDFTLKDDNLLDGNSLPAKITYTNNGLNLENGTDNDKVSVTLSGNVEKVNVTNQRVTKILTIGLDQEQANRAKPGVYTGSIVITAVYDI